MSRTPIPVNPDVLQRTRESIGYSREAAAAALDMTETSLGMIEEGVKTVTMARLRFMAEKYDRLLIALLLPERPNDEDDLPDFRLSPEYRSKPWSPELRKAFRRVVG